MWHAHLQPRNTEGWEGCFSHTEKMSPNKLKYSFILGQVQRTWPTFPRCLRSHTGRHFEYITSNFPRRVHLQSHLHQYRKSQTYEKPFGSIFLRVPRQVSMLQWSVNVNRLFFSWHTITIIYSKISLTRTYILSSISRTLMTWTLTVGIIWKETKISSLSMCLWLHKANSTGVKLFSFFFLFFLFFP